MTPQLPPEIYELVVSGILGGSSAAWFVVDTIRLRRALPHSKETHDRVFGSIVGLAVATIGLAGVVQFYLG